MENLIRFSLFGDFERFSTNNLESYMKLINFFGQKGYRPSTANELQLQPNGQARVIIMPTFLNDSNAAVDITSNRINFQKTVNTVSTISTLNEEFSNEFSDWMGIFISEIGVSSNRVALNCDILCDDNLSTEMPTQSKYFDDTKNTEMSVRNVARKMIEQEESNIIIEKYVNVQNGFTKYAYDINSIGEDQRVRFNDNIKVMYEAYIQVALEIEKGMK